MRGTNLLGRHVKPLLKRAGLPAIRLPDLRHTRATILLMAGKHPKYVQELLNHASISITLDTYSHVIEGMDGGLADAMDEALKAPPTHRDVSSMASRARSVSRSFLSAVCLHQNVLWDTPGQCS
jgi:hypothetical protein